VIVRVAALLLAALLAAPAAVGAEGWFMAGHDAANTNRSTVVSAQAPALLPGWPRFSDTPLVGPDGTVYSGDAVLNRDGTVRQNLPFYVQAIGPDGRLFTWTGAGDSVSVYASGGTLLWRTPGLGLGPEASDRYMRPAPDGGVYVVGELGMAALDASGHERWRVNQQVTPVVGSDGTVYLGAEGVNVQWRLVVARRPDGQTLWQRQFPGPGGPRAVANDGTVLIQAGGALWALAPDASERWTVAPHGATGLAGAAVGADGTVYAVFTRDIGRVDALWAVGPDGRVRWTFRAPDIWGGSPIVGGDGTIYVGGSPLRALHPDGRLAWSLPVGRPLVPESIGTDGTLYVYAPPLERLYAAPGFTLALAGPSAPAAIRLPNPARQRSLISGLRLPTTRFRMSGSISLCPSPGRGCRPRYPLDGTLRFTLKRDAVVSLVVRRARDQRVVTRFVRRVRAGTAWRSMSDVAGTLAPGRYTVGARAAAGVARVSTRPLSFTVVR
jgi:outer membrane protein assembly factor BamB